ncbi:CPBP family intramembrane glutamic endopeptidase [Butyrivibrio proteoclasticus]|uniref:CPBP family intramembrane glutamic endopeptidase n=1 Tax=Butyrivibrio proteoclasticus TaxID=43305 RepID=UPI00047DA71D|nr:type II CAAX endopeptidase family protein [Butyrivibrio proteoclasticus]
MNRNIANRSFLYIVALNIICNFALVYVMAKIPNFPVWAVNMILEASVAIPVIIVALVHGEKIKELVPFKKIRISSALLTMLFTVLMFPTVALVNAISMLFVRNTVSSMTSEILAWPMGVMLVSIGVFGPFVEEFVFRGFYLHSYKKSGKVFGAIMLSALLFGLIHLNLNQCMYAVVMGIMLALLVEATGSVLTSFICHGLFNSIEVVMMYSLGDVAAQSTGVLDKKTLLYGIVVYLLISLVTLPLAFCVVYKISQLEGRNERFLSILKDKKGSAELLTPWLIPGVVLAVIFMILQIVGFYVIFRLFGY